MVTLLCYYRGTNRPCLHATLSSGKPKSRFPVSSHEWGFRTSIMHGSEAFQYTRLVRVTSPFNVPCSSFTQRPMKEIFRLGAYIPWASGRAGDERGSPKPVFFPSKFRPVCAKFVLFTACSHAAARVRIWALLLPDCRPSSSE